MHGHYSAFPVPERVWGDQHGLTKRELFAAMAMQGILSRHADLPELNALGAVRCADALIAELSKEQP